MYRLMLINGIWYGTQIKSVKDDSENIENLIGVGDVVLLCEDIKKGVEALKINLLDIAPLEGYFKPAKNI